MTKEKRKKLKKGDIIVIEGRRWFEKTNGNTYHSVSVQVNEDQPLENKFSYGYDDSYLQTARELLEQKYILPIDEKRALWNLKQKGIRLITFCADVNRKKDL
jgi:ASC-1-like (ASCH) protein